MYRQLNGIPGIARYLTHIAHREPRTRLFAVARSLIALSQFCVIAFNSDSTLFGSPLGSTPGCAGIAAGSLWCVSGGSRTGLILARFLALTVLAVVFTGYRPSWSCIPHWYVSASLSMCMTPVNGGEFASQAITFLVIPVCLGDSRQWQWTAPRTPLAGRWAGRAAAALLALRWQVVVIYVETAVSKVSNPAWRDGRAMPAVFTDPELGLPVFAKPLRAAVDSPLLMTVMGWLVVATEILIALLLVGPARFRRWGVLIALALHTSIIILIGLLPFGVIMCAVALLAVSEGRGVLDRSASNCATCQPGRRLEWSSG